MYDLQTEEKIQIDSLIQNWNIDLIYDYINNLLNDRFNDWRNFDNEDL